MHASAGDRIAIPGTHVGDPGRVGVVLEVRGADGSPPYVVRWEDGHQGVCWPGPQTRIQHEGRLDLD